MVKQASESVVGCPPEAQVLALDDLFDLEGHGGSVFLLRDDFSGTNVNGTLLFDLDDMALDLGEFFRLPPDISPVLFTNTVSRSGTNRVEHPLSGVGRRGTISAVVVEVLQKNIGILTNVAKVHALATALEEEQAIEILKEG
jgi:hypothetical protein